jgi:hypothetical protein
MSELCTIIHCGKFNADYTDYGCWIGRGLLTPCSADTEGVIFAHANI